MIIFFTVVASLAGLAIVICICLQTASPDAGFSAAMGGGSDSGASRKGGTDLMLERVLKVSAVVWVAACLILAVLEAHLGGSAFTGG
jgi:protein translocase SecG subunit